MACTVISLVLTNSSWQSGYLEIWHTRIDGQTLEHWINDGLMTIFFLLVGLEIERELYKGELTSLKNALLPIGAAVGGMVVPAGIYFLVNLQSGNTAGFGIPMATDIAFALGVLVLVGDRVP